jgi:hypothetical protein
MTSKTRLLNLPSAMHTFPYRFPGLSYLLFDGSFNRAKREFRLGASAGECCFAIDA